MRFITINRANSTNLNIYLQTFMLDAINRE